MHGTPVWISAQNQLRVQRSFIKCSHLNVAVKSMKQNETTAVGYIRKISATEAHPNR